MKEFAGMVISTNINHDRSYPNSYQNNKNHHRNNIRRCISHNHGGHMSTACRSPEWDHKRSFHHHKMRIKLITNRETINYFKEKFYYLLFKNRHHNSGIIRTIQQEIEKMNTMDLISTLWIIGNLKNKANKGNKTHNNQNSLNHRKWKNDKRSTYRHTSNRSSYKPKSPDKPVNNKTSTPPHSNRRRHGKTPTQHEEKITINLQSF